MTAGARRGGTWASLIIAGVLVSSLGACAGRVVEEGPGGGGGGATDGDDGGTGGDAAAGGDGSTASHGGDAGGNGDGSGGGAGEPAYNARPPMRTCPTMGGAMFPVDDGAGGSFCMDAVEVTRSAYASFLSTSPGASQVPASATACQGSGDFAVAVVGDCATDPTGGDSAADPVACVDWCDAVTFCAWAGKRLCGKIGGGSLTADEYEDPGASAWFRACAAGGQRDYPYGLGYDDAACNAKGLQSGDDWAPRIAGTTTGCFDATHRLFDLSGNVEEWEDACTDGECRLRGGNYQDVLPATLACNANLTDDIHTPEPWRGFRCCAD